MNQADLTSMLQDWGVKKETVSKLNEESLSWASHVVYGMTHFDQVDNYDDIPEWRALFCEKLSEGWSKQELSRKEIYEAAQSMANHFLNN